MDRMDIIELVIFGLMLILILSALVANQIFDNRYKELLGNEFQIQVVSPEGNVYVIE